MPNYGKNVANVSQFLYSNSQILLVIFLFDGYILLCRSTLAKGIDTSSYGAVVTVLPSEDFLSARILVSLDFFRFLFISNVVLLTMTSILVD
jgi:hypothetical protein